MMRLIFKTIFLYLTLASFFSCDKSEDAEYVYAQTYCSDVWDNSGQIIMDQFNSETNFENYLAAEGISFTNYSFELENEPEECEACSCLSGYVFRITTSNEFEDELLNLGFIASE